MSADISAEFMSDWYIYYTKVVSQGKICESII